DPVRFARRRKSEHKSPKVSDALRDDNPLPDFSAHQMQKSPTTRSGFLESDSLPYGQVVVNVFGSWAMTTPRAVAPTSTSWPLGLSAAVIGPMIGSLIGIVPTLR